MTVLNLSEAIELGKCLERPGSPLSFRGCAIGLGMAAVGVPKKTRTAEKAKELWPWIGQVSGRTLFGLSTTTYMQQIGDWYFNVRIGRMTMAELVQRVRAIEPCAENGFTIGAQAQANRANWKSVGTDGVTV